MIAWVNISLHTPLRHSKQASQRREAPAVARVMCTLDVECLALTKFSVLNHATGARSHISKQASRECDHPHSQGVIWGPLFTIHSIQP